MAQNLVGWAYGDGNGVDQDSDAALYWYGLAAEQGFEKAYYNLGLFYHEGRPGHPADLQKAIMNYERAIELGNSYAMNDRAMMFENGEGGRVDKDAAIDLYRRASEMGNERAQNSLALVYVRGDGAPRDALRALGLFTQAALGGEISAVSNLGVMYLNGYGTGKNLMAAFALYQLGAYRGDALAAVNLAHLLVEKTEMDWHDPALGYAWCLSALTRTAPAQLEEYTADCATLADMIDAETIAAAEAIVAAARPALLDE